MWNMMCDVMPTISEDSISQRSSQFSGEDANFEQLMVSMLDERDKLMDSLRETQERLGETEIKLSEVEKERDSLQRQIAANLPQSRVSQESTEINIDEEDAENSRNETELEDMGADRSPQPGPSNEQQKSCTQQTKHFTELQPAKSARAVSEVKSNSSLVRNNNNMETPTSKRASTTRERIIEKKRLVENERPDMLMTAMDKLDKISEKATATKDDNFDHFGKYIGSLLRTLPTEQALKLQQEMITLALNAHMANSMSPPSRRRDATLADDFSPESADTWFSDLSAAVGSYQ